jgi:two-component system, OmpR family, heavy metal sensor histidine kinase CusS
MSSTTGPEARSAPPRAPAPAPKEHRPLSLATRLTLWYAGWSALLLIGATGYLYWTLATSVRGETSDFVREEIRVLRAIIVREEGVSEALRFEVESEWSVPRDTPVYVRILGTDGGVLLETPEMGRRLPPAMFPQPLPADSEPVHLAEVHVAGRTPFRTVAARAAGPGGAPERIIQMAVDVTSQERVLAVFRWRSFALVVVAIATSVAVGRRIAGRGLRRVREISDAAARVQPPALHPRIRAGRLPAELAALARTFNSMLDRLQESFERQGRFSADIAHEIRTPVNNIRGEAEVALQRARPAEEYREALESCLEECARLTRIIDALLFLGRAENVETAIGRERVEVGEEIARVTEFYEAAAAEADVRLELALDGRIEARVDRTLMQRAVGNLVENALHHTPAGGLVRVSGERRENTLTIEVRDTGRGIAPEHLPHVFERFYRADPSRPANPGGFGLGLAIVKAIAELHGGSVTIASAPGEGTTVRLSLPAGDDEKLMLGS